MADKDLRDKKVKVMTYRVLFLKRGLEAAFAEQEELLHEDMTSQELKTWKIAEFVRALPHVNQPQKWKRKHYPPQAEDGKIVALPDKDLKYLDVHCSTEACFRPEPFRYRKRKIKVLEEIRDRLSEPADGHRVRLPQSGLLGGALDPDRSQFGDEFFHFPDFMGQRPAPGGTKLTGWIILRFDKPQGDWVDFDILYFGWGSYDEIFWGGGQVYEFRRNRALPFPLPNIGPIPTPNRARLNLRTGKVKNVEIHSVFQNSTIGEVDRLNRIGFAFPFFYPPAPPLTEVLRKKLRIPPDLPIYGDVELDLDREGNIISFRLESQTVAPVTVFPFIKELQVLFPPFAWSPGGQFYFANPARCLPGTPPDDCPNDPNGVALPGDAFFHPHFELTAPATAELPARAPAPACPPEPISSALLVAARGRLFQIGGLNDSGVTGAVRIYDAAKNEWSDGTELPTPVHSASGGVIDRHIYVAGGWADAKATRSSSKLQVLDLDTMKWRRGKPLPVPVAEAAGTAVGGQLLVASGRTKKAGAADSITRAFQIYDPQKDAWRQGSAATVPSAGAAAVEAQGKFFMINGILPSGNLSNRVSIYDPQSGQWGLGPETRRGACECVAGVANRRILLFGGRALRGWTTQRTRTLELDRLDEWHRDPLGTDPWRGGVSGLLPTAGSGAAVLGGTFFVVGGRVQTAADDAPGVNTNAVQAFNPFAGWRACDRPLITSYDILNAASLNANAFYIKPENPQVGIVRGLMTLSPASRAVLFGFNLASQGGQASPGQPPLTELDGLSIEIDGQPAFMLSVRPSPAPLQDRIDFLVPPGLKVRSRPAGATLRVIKKSSDGRQQTATARFYLRSTAPGIFIYSYGEAREPYFLNGSSLVACNPDKTFNAAVQPAVPGDALTIYATGLAALAAKKDGAKALKAEIAGQKVSVASLAPDKDRPGVQLVTLRIPKDFKEFSNNVPIRLQADGVASNLVVAAVAEKLIRPTPPVPCQMGVGIFVDGQTPQP